MNPTSDRVSAVPSGGSGPGARFHTTTQVQLGDMTSEGRAENLTPILELTGGEW